MGHVGMTCRLHSLGKRSEYLNRMYFGPESIPTWVLWAHIKFDVGPWTLLLPLPSYPRMREWEEHENDYRF